jgi:hypothetical protein
MDGGQATLASMVRLRTGLLLERINRFEWWEAAKTLTSWVAEGFLAIVPSFGIHDGITEVATGRLLPVAQALGSAGILGIAYPVALVTLGWVLLERRDLVNVSGS